MSNTLIATAPFVCRSRERYTRNAAFTRESFDLEPATDAISAAACPQSIAARDLDSYGEINVQSTLLRTKPLARECECARVLGIRGSSRGGASC